MDNLRIELEQTAFLPGEQIAATATWQGLPPGSSLEARLFWYTQGKGTQDVEVVQSVQIASGRGSGSSRISLTLPDGPPSFSGKLLSLLWAIELVELTSGSCVRAELVCGPQRREITY